MNDQEHLTRMKTQPVLSLDELEVGMKVYVDVASNGVKDAMGTGTIRGIGIVRRIDPWVYHPESEGHIEVEVVEGLPWKSDKGLCTVFPSSLKRYE